MTEFAAEQDTALQTMIASAAGPELSAGVTVDLDALAERVLALLVRELRIERERLGRWGAD